MRDGDLLGRDAEPVGGDLGENGAVALARWRRPDADDRPCCRRGSEARCLLRHGAGDLEIAADADAAQLALFFAAACARRSPVVGRASACSNTAGKSPLS